MLRTGLGPERFRALRGALEEVAQDEMTFARLFDPAVAHQPLDPLEPALERPLLEAGLVERIGDYLIGRHRVRRRAERFYLMDLGGAEYHQDVWPETDALLGALEAAPPGTLLDVGTGCGIVAIEAAARGHRV